jgi:hypothetical protein
MKRPNNRLLVVGGLSGAIAAAAVGIALTSHGATHTVASVQHVKLAAAQQPNAPAEQPAATDPDGATGPNDQTTVDATPETTAPEAASTGEAATPNDGSGGHEDNPADPNAAHDFNGSE